MVETTGWNQPLEPEFHLLTTHGTLKPRTASFPPKGKGSFGLKFILGWSKLVEP